MTGRRIPPPPEGWNDEDFPDNPGGFPWVPGDYWKDARGEWQARTPNGAHASLRGHDVTEHEDGTISVSPSIECNHPRYNCPGPYWHGYLTSGVWKEC